MAIRDRRKHIRYLIKTGLYTVIPSNLLVGHVKNISKGGLLFTCMATESPIDKILTLVIFSNDKKVYLRDVSFVVVSTNNLDNHVPCSSLQMRQIRGALIELSEDQESQLDQFLSNC